MVFSLGISASLWAVDAKG